MRYDHYITFPSGNRWPENVICVDCVSTIDRDGLGSASTRPELLSWNAICLHNTDAGYKVVRTASGTNAGSWWRCLAVLTKDHGGVWVFSHQCSRAWALLELWQRIEDESISIVGHDVRTSERSQDAVPSVQPNVGIRAVPKSAGTMRRMRDRTTGYLVIEDPPCIARLRHTNCNRWFQWADTRNYGLNVADTVARGQCVASYLAQSFTAMADVFRELKLGSLQATAGSQAMYAWRASYLREGVYCHADKRILDEESRGKYGGRCEAYAVGDCGNACYHVDYRSMYAGVCSACPMPIRVRGYTTDRHTAERQCNASPYNAVATVDIDTEEPAYPYRHNGLVIYPTGQFTTTLSGPELTDAVTLGRVTAWHSAAWYHMEYSLREYATTLYSRRFAMGNGNHHPCEAIIKQLLVCLPGKLGQRERQWLHRPDCEPASYYGNWWGTNRSGEPCRYRSIAGHVYQDSIGNYSPNAVPAVSAFVASAGRMKLLEAIRITGWDNVYYVDTDSLFVNRAGYDNLCEAGMIAPSTLGYLRYISGPSSLEVHGIKHYVSAGKLTCAGQRNGVSVDLGDGETYAHYHAPAEYIRGGERPRSEVRILRYQKRQKYRHGCVQPDGRVRSWHVEKGELC